MFMMTNSTNACDDAHCTQMLRDLYKTIIDPLASMWRGMVKNKLYIYIYSRYSFIEEDYAHP